MGVIKRTAWVAAWALSLVVAGLWGRAHAAETSPSHFEGVYTGENFGFRVDHMKIDRSGRLIEAPSGTFVVRIDGLWHTAQQSTPKLP
jgi:hypothetical protein